MSWRDAFRLSEVAFSELALQAVYAFRQGNLLPGGASKNLVPRARRRVVQSKVVISGVLGLLAVGAAVLIRARLTDANLFPGVPVGLFESAVIAGALALDVALLWWTGVQVIPTLLSSGVLPVLEPLPIDDRTLGRVAVLLYVRLFDLPVLTILVVTPLMIGLVLGPWAGLATLPGLVVAVAYALALSLLTGRFFLRRVQGSRGGGGRTLLRWAYLVLWLVPAFALFAVITTAPALFTFLASLAANGPSTGATLFVTAFPFPLASLPAIANGGTSSLAILSPGAELALALAAIGYGLVGAWATLWLVGSVRSLDQLPVRTIVDLPTEAFVLRPSGTARAVLLKDLRIASRTPGYAFLILLPILDAVAIGLLTYASPLQSTIASSLALGAVTAAALLATFFGPAFFAIEVIAYSYGRTLPLSNRSILFGKVALVALIYLVAAALIVGFTLLRLFDPLVFLAFVAAELPAVVAASFLELGLLFRWARRRGLAITNLYSGAWFAAIVSIPGLILAGFPIFLYYLAHAAGSSLGLEAMVLAALGELLISMPIALGRGAS